MRSSSVPTGEARIFSNYEQAVQYLQSREEMPVIKASGLAAGKGVILPDTLEQAVEALGRIMKQRVFGNAGETVVIEERLTGPEVSVFALVDGRNIYVLETCQDHKRLLEGDEGPNTGGMGAYSPVSWLDDHLLARIEHEVLVPTVDALVREEIEYRGVLYAGLMITPAGPKVIEFNCRFGDPECQALMTRLKSDVLPALWATAAGRLDEVEMRWDERASCIVVMAAPGYPGSCKKGLPISGLREATELEDVNVFHAGTKRADDAIVTSGGRVLGVTALGDTLTDARERALQACDLIHFDGAQLRRDIGMGSGALR
jgi:phosphoribosylamine--glycine ligase